MIKNKNSVELLKEYDELQQAGERYITNKWKFLREYTRSYLIASGCYNKDGERINVETFNSDQTNEIDLLESSLGRLKLCADYRLPSRSDKEAIISRDAESDEVLFACDNVLRRLEWNDPFFLRLALSAFTVHRLAYLMFRLPTKKEKSVFMSIIGAGSLLFFWFLAFMLVLASPYFVSVALISVIKGNEGSTILMMYFIGFTIYLMIALKGKEKKRKNNNSIYEYDYQFEYDEWETLNSNKTSLYTVGAGAKFYFQEMVKKGVNIPPIAIDLCVALEDSLYKKT